MAEFDLIELIKRRCPKARADVRLGIGDDAAVVAVPVGHELVCSVDTLVAGVHFPLDTDAADLGWKSLAVNLSDLAAMGATPAWALLSLTLPTADADFVEPLRRWICRTGRASPARPDWRRHHARATVDHGCRAWLRAERTRACAAMARWHR
ncbi:MAG: AIR synthase related protein [Burkholderiaceae bacterium]